MYFKPVQSFEKRCLGNDQGSNDNTFENILNRILGVDLVRVCFERVFKLNLVQSDTGATVVDNYYMCGINKTYRRDCCDV